jgi:hypothetical protein
MRRQDRSIVAPYHSSDPLSLWGSRGPFGGADIPVCHLAELPLAPVRSAFPPGEGAVGEAHASHVRYTPRPAHRIDREPLPLSLTACAVPTLAMHAESPL